MDPQTTWKLLIEEWTQGNWIDVYELAEALQQWLERGGFPPDTCGSEHVGFDWNRTVAMAVCEFTLRIAVAGIESPNGIPPNVPFALSCQDCSNEGPDKYADAVAEGWTSLRYTPAGLSENFLGRCPTCQKAEA